MWRNLFSRVGLPCAAAAATAAAASLFSLQQHHQQSQPPASPKQHHRTYLQPVPSNNASDNLRCCDRVLPGGRWDSNWDALDNAEHPAPGVRRIVLVRHGRFRGSTRQLDDLGRQQADLLGKRLAELHARHSICRLVSSSSTRAVETAELALEHLPHLTRFECPMLTEVGCPCPPEPRVRDEFIPEHRYHEGGARVEAAFRRHIHRATPEDPGCGNVGSLEVLVCHANVIRYFVCRALQLPPEAWLRFSLDHCSITWLDVFPDGSVSLRSFSDSGYLPTGFVTSANVD